MCKVNVVHCTELIPLFKDNKQTHEEIFFITTTSVGRRPIKYGKCNLINSEVTPEWPANIIYTTTDNDRMEKCRVPLITTINIWYRLLYYCSWWSAGLCCWSSAAAPENTLIYPGWNGMERK